MKPTTQQLNRLEHDRMTRLERPHVWIGGLYCPEARMHFYSAPHSGDGNILCPGCGTVVREEVARG